MISAPTEVARRLTTAVDRARLITRRQHLKTMIRGNTLTRSSHCVTLKINAIYLLKFNLDFQKYVISLICEWLVFLFVKQSCWNSLVIVIYLEVKMVVVVVLFVLRPRVINIKQVVIICVKYA